MALTSVHFSPIKKGSEANNNREKNLDHVLSELSYRNEKHIEENSAIDPLLAKIKADYKNAHGMRLSKNTTPIREAVIVIKEDTTIAELLAASNECCRRFGIKPLQIYTHKDEGHLDKYNQWKPNFHAHIVFCWYNFNTHRTFKLNKYAMYDIQTIFADALSMERGKSSDMRHLNSVQYKIYKEEKRLKTLEYAIKVTEAEWEEKNQARKVEEGKLAAIAAKRQQIDKEANALKTSINLLRNIIAKTIEYLSQKGQYEDFLKEAEFNADEKKILSYIRDICNKGMTLM